MFPTWPCNAVRTLLGTLLIVFVCPLTLTVTELCWVSTETTDPDRFKVDAPALVPTPAQAVNRTITTRAAIPTIPRLITLRFIFSLLFSSYRFLCAGVIICARVSFFIYVRLYPNFLGLTMLYGTVKMLGCT